VRAVAGAVGALVIAYDLAPQTSTPFPWATLTVSVNVKLGIGWVMAPLATRTDVVIGESVALLIVEVKHGSIMII